MGYYSLKAFSVANLSVFSVFSMLGGMLLPFLLGVIVYNEPLTVKDYVATGIALLASIFIAI